VAPPDPTSFWAQVRLNVVSWLIIVAVGGVGYIGWTVPRLLQVVISGQADLQQQQTETQKLVVGVERRVTVLELRR
jgi:cell division protein FtsB